MPERLTRYLLLHSLIIRPGLETSDPQAAMSRYMDVLGTRHKTLRGKHVMVFGYGGRFEIGVRLLEAGADHVILCEKYAPADDVYNATLLAKYASYLVLQDGRPRPRPERMTLLNADIRDLHSPGDFPLMDVVISSSVYEHLEDVDGVTRALAALTKPDGLQIHYVDLRDHYFRYPFEMLSYSESIWRAWLNPTSNHNRFRLWEYQRVFEEYFEEVEIQILERYEAAFLKARPRIRPEFLSGNLQDDSVALILVIASRPRK
jgi:2-polyprenyl-3-methyl-5-hydroxy-6-metoxy-1,4-benzoquinol methylase